MRRLCRFAKAVSGLGIVVLVCFVARMELNSPPHAEAREPSVLLSTVIGAPAPPALTLSSDFPHLVPHPPAGLTPEQERPWFDTFSFQEFIALNWPALQGQRGIPMSPNDPATFKAAFAPNASGDYPQVVWGSWKQAYELFEQGSVRPSVWSSFDAVLPCVNPLTTPPKTFLDATDKDINQSFRFPLIDQSRNYARYEIRLNESEYTLIRGQDAQPTSWLYLTPNLVSASPVTFPMSTAAILGAVEVKAAWKPMTAADDPQRYYVVNALVLLNPVTKEAQYQKMGLVALHIAHKTTPFSEWVWSTFEHVHNIQAPHGITPSYNNGTGPTPPSGFDQHPPFYTGTTPFPPNPVPVQVGRVNPIPTTPAGTSTVDLNAAFQGLVDGTVWKNYQLIDTQWPTHPTQFKLPGPPANGQYPGDCGVPFPSDGVANTVVETYTQGPTPGFGNSCMSCHYLTARTDFSWVLGDRNHAPVTPADQAHFLEVGRMAPRRALDALSKIEAPEANKAAALRQALETLNPGQEHSK
jgi:hypothetical protein